MRCRRAQALMDMYINEGLSPDEREPFEIHLHDCRLCQQQLANLQEAKTLPDGKTVSPKTIMTAVQGTPGVSRYRVVQESRSKVTIELMRRKNDPEVSIEELIDRCRNVLGDEVEINVVARGRENLKAKFRPVISKLTVDREPRWTEPYQKSLD